MLYGFPVSFIACILITPFVIRLNILDRPDYRKIHEKPVPKAGGISIFATVIFLEIILLLFFRSRIGIQFKEFTSIPAATILLFAAGILDDMRELKPGAKLAVQLVAALATASFSVHFHVSGNSLLNFLATVVWIIGIVNAVNLIDGLDGLAAGVALISGAGFCITGLINEAGMLVFLSTILMGSCLGFLKYNFRPARIFMGDTGSMPLGYSLAILGILCENAAGGETAILLPILMLGIPIFDTLLTIVRRYLNNRPIFAPDKSHFYNLIMDIKGVGHKNTVLILYGLNIILAVISVLAGILPDIYRVVIFCTIAITAAVASYKMGFIRTDTLSAISSNRLEG